MLYSFEGKLRYSLGRFSMWTLGIESSMCFVVFTLMHDMVLQGFPCNMESYSWDSLGVVFDGLIRNVGLHNDNVLAESEGIQALVLRFLQMIG